MVRRTSGGHCGWPHGAFPQITHCRVTAVLTFLRDEGLRGWASAGRRSAGWALPGRV